MGPRRVAYGSSACRRIRRSSDGAATGRCARVRRWGWPRGATHRWEWHRGATHRWVRFASPRAAGGARRSGVPAARGRWARPAARWGWLPSSAWAARGTYHPRVRGTGRPRCPSSVFRPPAAGVWLAAVGSTRRWAGASCRCAGSTRRSVAPSCRWVVSVRRPAAPVRRRTGTRSVALVGRSVSQAGWLAVGSGCRWVPSGFLGSFQPYTAVASTGWFVSRGDATSQPLTGATWLSSG